MLAWFHNKQHLVNCIDEHFPLFINTYEHPLLFFLLLLISILRTTSSPVTEFNIGNRSILMMVLYHLYTFIRLSSIKKDELTSFISNYYVFSSEGVNIYASHWVAEKFLWFFTKSRVVVFCFSVKHPYLSFRITNKK